MLCRVNDASRQSQSALGGVIINVPQRNIIFLSLSFFFRKKKPMFTNETKLLISYLLGQTVDIQYVCIISLKREIIFL